MHLCLPDEVDNHDVPFAAVIGWISNVTCSNTIPPVARHMLPQTFQKHPFLSPLVSGTLFRPVSTNIFGWFSAGSFPFLLFMKLPRSSHDSSMISVVPTAGTYCTERSLDQSTLIHGSGRLLSVHPP